MLVHVCITVSDEDAGRTVEINEEAPAFASHRDIFDLAHKAAYAAEAAISAQPPGPRV